MATTWDSGNAAAGVVLSNNDLTVTNGGGSYVAGVLATFSMSSGKGYFEVIYDASGSSVSVGVAVASRDLDGTNTTDVWVHISSFGTTGGDGASGPMFAAWSAGDVIGVAVDVDAGKIWFARNGAWLQGDPAAGTGEVFSTVDTGVDIYPFTQVVSGPAQVTAAFSEASWSYSAPSGFSAFEQSNDPDPDPQPPNNTITYPDPDVTPPTHSAITKQTYSTGDSWSLVITLNGQNVSDQISIDELVKIDAVEGAAALCKFTLKPDTGVIDVADWIGTAVTVDYVLDSTKRVFTGVVKTPTLDLRTGKVDFLCTDNLKASIEAMTTTAIDAAVGGYHSDYVFGEDNDKFDYLRNKVSTRFVEYDLDVNGSGVLSSLTPVATPHLTITEADVVGGISGKSIKLADRQLLKNKVTVGFEFGYQRLRHREREFIWTSTRNLESYLTIMSFDLPTKTMVKGAVESAGWAYRLDNYVELPQSGVYYGVNLVNLSHEFLFEAEFTAAKRFSQNIVEDYQVTVQAPQSQAQIGDSELTELYSVRAEYDASEWEDFELYESAPAGFTLSANGDYYYDMVDREIDGRNAFDNAIKTAIAKASNKIKRTHRENTVSIDILCQPGLQRFHTLQLTYNDGLTSISAKGKVKELHHVFDLKRAIPRTTVVLAISKTGATTPPPEPAIAVPTVADTSDSAETPSVYALDTNLSFLAADPPYDETWEGHTGNAGVQEVGAPVYPYRFQVRTQPVGAEHRSERKVTAPSTVDIPINNDTLTIEVLQ